MKVQGMEQGACWGPMIDMYLDKLYKIIYESLILR